tara:strand:+ start:512 stop:775 length:264 start_codon:yes stop_codon:yes gene_type:complete
MEEQIEYNYLKIIRGEVPLCVIRVIKGSLEELITFDILTDKGLTIKAASKTLYDALSDSGSSIEYFNEDDLKILQDIDWDSIDIDDD